MLYCGMVRTGWYSSHPLSCTCYWCNEGRPQQAWS